VQWQVLVCAWQQIISVHNAEESLSLDSNYQSYSKKLLGFR